MDLSRWLLLKLHQLMTSESLTKNWRGFCLLTRRSRLRSLNENRRPAAIHPRNVKNLRRVHKLSEMSISFSEDRTRFDSRHSCLIGLRCWLENVTSWLVSRRFKFSSYHFINCVLKWSESANSEKELNVKKDLSPATQRLIRQMMKEP